MKSVNRLSDAECAVLRVLWENGEPMRPLTVRERLASTQDWSISTVQTLLSRLKEKGAVSLVPMSHLRVYQAALSREEYVLSQIEQLLLDTAQPSPLPLLRAMLKKLPLTEEEKQQLCTLLQKEK